MDPERLRQLEDLFHAVRDRPEARSAILAQTDPDLRRDLESMLDDRSGGLLGSPVAEAAAQLLEQPDSGQGPVVQDTHIGQLVGACRIVAKIAEGGMGVVYQAEQSQPRRMVALKMIRGGTLLQEQSVRLFHREAEALGRLRHPGIASVYESGQTGAGEHYFTMELVPGEPLHHFLQRRHAGRGDKAALRLRLTLFQKICAAVGYAHQNGVIHCDLKPSNILVTVEAAGETAPEIKILDFGLARITHENTAATTLISGFQGTLAYMSPEQTRGGADAIDLRTDVYSLGVIFYEMLMGEPPYEVRGKELFAAIREICEQPPKPFRNLPGALSLDPDLECVVRKALEKEPARRYQSVAALGEDVHRYEHLQPVLAQPPSAVYQLRKLVARHRLAFGFLVSLLVVLVAFAASMTVQARRIAVEAAAARQVSDFLVGLFEVSDPSEARGNSITAHELLDKGARKIDRELKDQPLIQARMQFTIGKVLIELGSLQEAVALLERALATQQSHLPANDPALVETLDRLATAYQGQGKYEPAERLFVRAAGIAAKAYGKDAYQTSEILTNLGGVYALTSRYPEAEKIFLSSLAIVGKTKGMDNEDAAEILNNLAFVAGARGRLDLAIDYTSRALQIREKLLAPDHPIVAESLANLGVIFWQAKRYAEAAPPLERSLAINQKALGREHAVVGQDMTNLANVYRDQGNFPKAEDLYLRALAIREKALGAEHPDVAHTLNRLAVLRLNQHNYTEALPLFKRSIAIYDKALGPNSLEAAMARANFADLYTETRQFSQAEALYRVSVAALEQTAGADSPRLATVLDAYTRMLKAAGRAAEAVPLEARAKAIPHGPQ